MTDFYELTTAGAPPLDVETTKGYLRLSTRADDVNVALMVRAALLHGESYTGRDFRANTWTLLKDDFEDRICLLRSPVASVTSVERLVNGTFVAVAPSTYYLKKATQFSEILLESGQAWPTDADDKEHRVRVVFVTQAVRELDVATLAMLKHIAFMNENKGDCDVNLPTVVAEAARASGADSLYDQIRIARV